MDPRKGTATRLRCALGVIAAVVLILVPTRNAESQVAPQVVHAFSASAVTPNGLIQARDGNFYGTTESTLFRMTPGGALTTLHVFDCSIEGCGSAALIQARDGNLYGTNRDGGMFGGGTVFKATLGGVLTTLHAFECNTEGCRSAAALIEAGDGDFYGTTSEGGDPFGGVGGTVFRITATGVLSTLHSFECRVAEACFLDGAFPFSGLIQGKDGNLYGTTYGGGAFFGGTVFMLTPAGNLTTVHDFDCSTDGCSPFAALIQAKDGNFYGTTDGGGFGMGIFFKLTPGGLLTTLHTFDCIEGCSPHAALIQAKDGSFYVNDGGTIFKLTPKGAITTLHVFDCATEGCGPTAALVQAATVTSLALPLAVASGGGTVFKMAPNGKLTTLQSFGCTSAEGCFPTAALVQAKDGNFYGSAPQGGAFGDGTIFRLTPGGVLTTLHAFDCANEGCRTGLAAGLIQASDGNLYGTTFSGGSLGNGTVFKLTLEGVFTTLHAFDCGPGGCGPESALIEAGDGNLYGTTPGGGLFGWYHFQADPWRRLHHAA